MLRFYFHSFYLNPPSFAVDEMKNNGQPKIDINTRNYIARAQLLISALRKDNGFGYSVLVQKQSPKSKPRQSTVSY